MTAGEADASEAQPALTAAMAVRTGDHVERLVSVDKFTDELLFDQLRHQADPEADRVIADYMETVEIPAGEDVHQRAAGLMKAMLTLPVGSERHPESVTEYLSRPPALPEEWSSPERRKAGQDVFWTYAPQLGLGLWFASIPSGYAGARDAIVLGESVRLLSDAKSRFLETGQFLLDVMSPGGLEEGGLGARDIRHVRLVHALVRYLITKRPDLTDPDFTWKPDDGVPVNQMALLATQFTFDVVGLQALEKFGIRLSDEEAENYVHLWNVVGYLMGVRSDLLPLDRRTSAEVWERIKTHEYAESTQGVELTTAAIGAMKQLLPGTQLDGLPATGIREMIGNETAELLGVPPADWTRVLFWPGRAADRLAAVVNRRIPVGHQMSKLMGKLVYKKFLELEDGRQGERAGFEVDDELKKRLVLLSPQERVTRVKGRMTGLLPARATRG